MELGKVIQVIGPVVDIEFPVGELPDIYHAITITEQERRSCYFRAAAFGE